MFKLRSFLMLSIIFAVIFANSSPVFAKGGVEVHQTRIVFEADKQQGASAPVSIRNSSDEEMSVSVRKADYVIAEDGAFLVKDPGTTPNSANDFIRCEESEFTMKPGEDKTFDIMLDPGKKYILPEYSSTVLVKYIPKKALETDATLKTYTQIAITVRVLSGSLADKKSVELSTAKAPLELIGASGSRILGYGGKKNINLTFKNTGLVTVEPKISSAVDSLFSGRIEEIPPMDGYVMPGQSRTYKIGVSASSIFDIRTIHFEYSYKYIDKTFTGSCSFTYLVISYQMLIGLLILLCGIIWQTRLFRKRNRLLKQLLEQNRAFAEASAAGSPENVLSITSSESGNRTDNTNDSTNQQ